MKLLQVSDQILPLWIEPLLCDMNSQPDLQSSKPPVMLSTSKNLQHVRHQSSALYTASTVSSFSKPHRLPFYTMMSTLVICHHLVHETNRLRSWLSFGASPVPPTDSSLPDAPPISSHSSISHLLLINRNTWDWYPFSSFRNGNCLVAWLKMSTSVTISALVFAFVFVFSLRLLALWYRVVFCLFQLRKRAGVSKSE